MPARQTPFVVAGKVIHVEVIIKPTEACNGTCVYCSANGTMDQRRWLPAERLGEMFTILAGWLREDPKRNLRFIWHGGEPLLAGPAYYETVVAEQQRVFDGDLHRVKNVMQSNLSLVTDAWIPTLTKLIGDQTIGTSFDIVDGVRGLVGHRSLAEAWHQALRRLRSADIAVGVVYVVHRKSLGRVRDLYYYFRNLNPDSPTRFNPLYREGRATQRASEDLWITAEEYGRFLVELCDIWLDDDRRFGVMPLAEWYRAWQGRFGLCCDSRGTCTETHIGINPDGTVYGCGRASDNGAHALGNLFDDGVTALLRRQQDSQLSRRPQVLRQGACRDCRYWELCHGGCPMMAWLYYGDLMRETYFCEARRMLFEHYERRFGPPAHVGTAGEGPANTDACHVR